MTTPSEKYDAINAACVKAEQLVTRGKLLREALAGQMLLHLKDSTAAEHRGGIPFKYVNTQTLISERHVKVMTSATLSNMDSVDNPVACLVAHFPGHALKTRQLSRTIGPKYKLLACIPFNPAEPVTISEWSEDFGKLHD